MSDEAAHTAVEVEAPVAMATEDFRHETKYVVLSYMGLLPPSLELECDSSENEDRDDSSGKDGDEDDDTGKSTSSADSQLQVVGQLELEDSEIENDAEAENGDGVPNDDDEGSCESATKAEVPENTQGQVSVSSSLGKSQGTPKFVIEEYVEPSSTGKGQCVSGRHTQLTSLVMPLREELSQQLDALDEERGCASPRVWTASPRILPSASPRVLAPLSPEAVIASRIAAIGDQIMQEQQHQQELNSAVRKLLGLPQAKVTYDVFKEAASDVIDRDTTSGGWHQVASVLNFSRHLAFGLVKKGERSIGQLTEYSVQLIEENMANFIVEQGGWEAVYKMTLDDAELYSNPSEHSLPNSPWSEGLYLTLPPRKSSGSEVSDPSTGPPSPSWKEHGQPFLIPGKPHRVTPSNLLRTTPSNFESCRSADFGACNVSKEKCDAAGEMHYLDIENFDTESGYSSNVDTIPPSTGDDPKNLISETSDDLTKSDRRGSQCACTQTHRKTCRVQMLNMITVTWWQPCLGSTSPWKRRPTLRALEIQV
ncbi:bcl-2-like protein 13 [Ptychodera flava]|uniref:bcl-2-like protein 13 n=1 Tax=Ptychodera flava TaxID=63121 RepID=UPI00396A8148